MSTATKHHRKVHTAKHGGATVIIEIDGQKVVVSVDWIRGKGKRLKLKAVSTGPKVTFESH
jgi:hypothetical protein